MIKRLTGVIAAAVVRGQRSRRVGSVPVPTVLLRASLAVAASTALAVTASGAPAQATVSGPGGQVATAGVPAHPAAAASGRGWSVVPSPNPRAGNGVLNAVSCSATSVCTAVGLHVRESGLEVTLAERRGGGMWAVQSTPNPPGAAASALNGVSCVSRSACTGVGQFAVKPGAQRTLAERWNGSNWAIQPTPNPAGAPSSTLFAVVCPAAGTCTAVGTSNSKLLVERFGGARWRIQPAPVPHGAQSSELLGVTCTAATSCVAVGDYVNSAGADVTLAERWNGTAWHIQPTPLLPAAHDIGLPAVACPARAACTTVGGFANDGPGMVSLAERWRGSGTSAAQTAPAAFSSRAHRSIAGCLRAALGEGFAPGAAAPCNGPMFKALLPQRSQPASEIERICAASS